MTGTLSDVVSNLTMLPPFPKVTAKLLRLLDDTESSVEELAGVISSDPSLVLTVIHMANSPFYMCSRRIENIRDAILVLGIDTIKGITTAISVQQGLRKLCPQSQQFSALSYWKHSYATAISGARIASGHGAALRDKVYFAGLIHDVGKLLQAYFWPDSWDATVALAGRGDQPYADAELQIYGFHHYDITVQVLNSWQFPVEIVEILSKFLKFESGDADGHAAVRILGQAHDAVNELGYRYPEADAPAATTDVSSAIQDVQNSLEGELDYQLGVLQR